MLSLSNASKSLGGRLVLDDVSVTATPGTALVLLGPNGSGKSVLLRSLALIDPPDSGTLALDDHRVGFPIKGPLPFAPWPSLSMVFQQLHLWPHLTVEANVSLPARLHHGRTWDPTPILDQLDLAPLRTRFPAELSVGEQQRVAIGRALALSPRWLILDEPTAAIDIARSEQLLRILLDLKKAGTGLVVATHLLGFASALADQILYVEGGQIVEQGGPDILQEPRTPEFDRFLSLFGLQKVHRTEP